MNTTVLLVIWGACVMLSFAVATNVVVSHAVVLQ